MIELVKVLFRVLVGTTKFLFTNLAGTMLLALVGSFFFLGGCIGVATVEHESAPTKVSVADVEAAGLPKQKWLEITDGYVFWPQWIENTTQQIRRETSQGTTTETVEKERTEAHYVPVVSKALLDEWMKEYEEKHDQAAYDYS